MQIAERLSHDVIILDLQGRMTAERRDERLPSTVRRMLRQGYRSLVLNLEGVSYMDSTCLGEIIAAYAMLKDHGGQLRLLNVPRRIQHLLDLAKLTMIETLGSDETAVGGFVAAEQSRDRRSADHGTFQSARA